MNAVRTALAAVADLFVDDGVFATTILVWLVVCALVARAPLAPEARGGIMFAGLAVILIWSVVRATRTSTQK